MPRRPDIRFWIVLTTGGLGLAACLASIVADSRLAMFLLSAGGLLLFPAMVFVASRISGRPLSEAEDLYVGKRRPILEALLLMGSGMIALGQLLWPNRYADHSALFRAMLGVVSAVGIGIGACGLVRGTIGLWKVRSAAR